MAQLQLKPNHIHFKLLGKSWKLVVLDKKRYNRKHGADSVALTDGHKRAIYVGHEGKDYETIVHELVHAYLCELCTHSADLTTDAQEEIFAELMAKRGDEILRLGKALVKEIQKRGL